ncbi:MAG: arsenate reductase ArsC [Alphaproteobacteria bacterium]|nr:arsenate reductase ArsC [Alphaproteobacteria bacterium]
MSGRPLNTLFLCTGNSARSIIAECLLARLGGDRYRAFSAGSHPTGRVNPAALALLAARGHETGGLRSKSWDEFAGTGAAEMDIVITVCDSAAGESCPVWPGRPATAHWGFPDPAAVAGDAAAVEAAFAAAYDAIEAQIRSLVDLPVGNLDAAALADRLRRLAPSPQTR